MKKLVLLSAFLFLQVRPTAQIITYTHQNATYKTGATVQLVAGINGRHHLLQWLPGKSSMLTVYDNYLRAVSETALPFTIPENAFIRTVPFTNFYYLYYHVPQKKQYGFWKITAAGEATDMEAAFQNLLRVGFDRTDAINFEVAGQKGSVFITSLVYYPLTGMAQAIQVKTDSLLQLTGAYKVPFAFDARQEVVKSMVQADEDRIVILKNKLAYESENYLETIVVNLHDSSTTANRFSIRSKVFVKPDLYYIKADSSIIIHALTRDKDYITNMQYMFMARIDHLSTNTEARAFMKPTYVSSFVMVNSPVPVWLSYNSGYVPDPIMRSNVKLQDFEGFDPLSINEDKYLTKVLSTVFYLPAGIHPVKFYLADSNFTIARDSVVKNDKESYTLLANEWGRFTHNGNSYLVLRQEFKNAARGLVAISSDDRSRFTSYNLHVYDRHDYLLPQLQQMPDGSILIPYIYKKEAGLVKIRLDQRLELLRD